MNGQLWHWGTETLQFLPQRALWRQEGRVLMLADLHLGKAEAFQDKGDRRGGLADLATGVPASPPPLQTSCLRGHSGHPAYS